MTTIADSQPAIQATALRGEAVAAGMAAILAQALAGAGPPRAAPRSVVARAQNGPRRSSDMTPAARGGMMRTRRTPACAQETS
ncbi:MAG TPA: hypothetical protein VGO85_11795 [Caldimonas sp.]|jgi:hypothetical protein|nr:hypothetical protein [Caldimonas sp.]